MNGELPRAWRWRALAACAVLPPLVSALPFNRLAALAGGRRLGRADPAAPSDAALSGYVGYVLGRLPPPWRYTCLRRSLVLYHLMRRAGREVSLAIGVRRSPSGEFQAHAWLVKDGAPYLEGASPEHESFAVVALFPEARPS